MKKRFFIVGIAAAASILLALIGALILGSNSNNERPSALSPVSNAAEIYANAISAVSSAEDTALAVTKVRQTVLGNDIFTENARQTVSYRGYGSETLRAAIDETLTIGGHTVKSSEIFADGTAYVTVNSSNFSGQLSAAEYQSRLVPAALLDAALYENVRGFDNGQTYLILFDNPTAGENWAAEAGSEFLGARGAALVSHDGQLVQSVYAITFTRGGATVHLTVTAQAASSKISLDVPAEISQYAPITYLDGPRMLERASGYLMEANNLSASYSERIYCQAFGDERNRSLSLYTALLDNEWSARVDTETVLTNTGRTGDVVTHIHNELFINGGYTIRVDNGEATSKPEVDIETMHDYCKDQLVSTIMLPQDITDATYTETEDSLLISFSASESFAGLVSSNACQTLYQNPELLNELAEANTTDVLRGYLELDKNTGLPLGSGVDYSGIYTVEGLPYQLQFKADQTYDIPSATAEEKINEAAGQ